MHKQHDKSAEQSKETSSSIEADSTHGFFSMASSPDSVDSRQGENTAQQLPETLGDYQLVERLGAGGMGIVYRARQISADRMVALKLIRPDRLHDLGPERRDAVIERFRTEARAAARLDHDNIVRVYEVGQLGDRHYFSMQLVEGTDLAELIRDGPLVGRRAASYLEPIARALDHAHSLGILHRDLKPQNILIDRNSDRPLVADFGLAKLIEAENEQTRHGDVVGTPQYIAPEQARDSAAVTSAADIYALGATLYHLTTGRPPFHAAQPWETIRQVIGNQPVKPRLLSAAIDRDLETICLKCLEKEPARRYRSAAEVADELQRFLDHRPIQARPLGITARGWRWCRRNPIVAALTTLAAMLLVVTITGISYESWRARRAEKSAHAAVNDYFTIVSEDALLDQEGLQPVRRRLLRKALDYYTTFLEERSADGTIRHEVAATYFRIGRITAELESPAQALPWYRKALAIQQPLAERAADATPRHEALGDTRNAYATALFQTGEIERALAVFEQALSVRRELYRAAESREKHGRKFANTHMNLANLFVDQGNFDSAREHMAFAQTLRAELAGSSPNDVQLLRDFGRGHYSQAKLASNTGQLPEAARILQDRAIPTFRKLLDTDEKVIDDRYRLAVSLRLLGDVRLSLNGPGIESFDALLESRDILRTLAELNPTVSKYRTELADTLQGIGRLEVERNDYAAAIGPLDEARSLLEQMAVERAVSPRLRKQFALLLGLRGLALLHIGQVEDADDHFRQSLDVWQNLADDFPNDDEISAGLRGMRETLDLTKSSAD